MTIIIALFYISNVNIYHIYIYIEINGKMLNKFFLICNTLIQIFMTYIESVFNDQEEEKLCKFISRHLCN